MGSIVRQLKFGKGVILNRSESPFWPLLLISCWELPFCAWSYVSRGAHDASSTDVYNLSHSKLEFVLAPKLIRVYDSNLGKINDSKNFTYLPPS